MWEYLIECVYVYVCVCVCVQGAVVSTLEGHENFVFSLAAHPTQSYLVLVHHSLTHSLTHTHTHSHSLTHSLTHPCTD